MGVIHRRTSDGSSWRWEGIEVQKYRGNDATKQVLVGPDDGANNFALRYFTIAPRDFGSLDCHSHDHGVIIVSGRACVRLGERLEEIGPGDVVYIPEFERNQFENLTDDPLTFLCVIPPKPTAANAPAEVGNAGVGG
jgi:quercetin dioxygenase-like cupin family protein